MGHRHRDSRAKWTTTDADPPIPAAAFTAADVTKLLLVARGTSGGTTPVPNPPPPPTPDTTPPVISNVAATAPTTTGIHIAATTNEAATVVVRYGTTTAYGSSTSPSASGTAHGFDLTGLTPGQLYHYEVVATDTAGNVTRYVDRTFTTTALATLPGAPAGLVATGGPNMVGLAWVAPASNGGSPITGYRIRRNGAFLIDVGTTPSYANTGLTNGLTYTYTVAAITAVGEGPQSLSASATPAAGGDINPPIITGPVSSAPTPTTVTISWSTNEPADGQVEFGLTTAYGRLSTLEPTLLTAHSQDLTGLVPGKTYHYRVRARDAATNLALSPGRTFITPNTTPPATLGTIWGPGVGFETKANERLDGNKSAYRYRADRDGQVTHFAINQRGGAGYSLGTGGSGVRVTLRGGDPSGAVLASRTFVPGNPGGNWEQKTQYAFDAPATQVNGQLYHLVIENLDPSPAANYISVNVVLAWNPADTPRQPAFSDDFATLRYTGSWNLQNGYLAVFDLEYADASHFGNQYFAVITGEEGYITGANNMVRFRFTKGDGTLSVLAALVQVRRNNDGTDPLIVRLEQSDGTLIESVSIPASSIAKVAATELLRPVAWTRALFAATRTLTNGQTYNVRLSCASGTQYSVMPIRSLDADMGAWDGYYFRHGAGAGNGSSGQETTNGGASWVDLYPFDREDVAAYFELAA